MPFTASLGAQVSSTAADLGVQVPDLLGESP